MTSLTGSEPTGPGAVVAADDQDTPTTEAAAPAAPAVVVHGPATPEELAALVAVLSAASRGETAEPEGAGSTWAAHTTAMRQPVQHGPGAWRTSLRT